MGRVVERYTYRVTWSQEDGEFLGLCAEFPSLSHLDETSDKAWRGIHDLVAAAVEDMLSNKETPPEPLAVKEFSGNVALRLPPALHRRLSVEAAEAGVSLNRHLNEKLGR